MAPVQANRDFFYIDRSLLCGFPLNRYGQLKVTALTEMLGISRMWRQIVGRWPLASVIA